MSEPTEAIAPDGFLNGFDPQRERLHTVAAIIDRPSLYMGGPSRQSIAKAREILAALDALPSPLPVDVAFVALDPDFRAAPTDGEMESIIDRGKLVEDAKGGWSPPGYDDEVERLTKALHRANANCERFEREWYLRGDEIERLSALSTPEPVKAAPTDAVARARETIHDALMDSQYMAGTKAGWNAAQDDDPEAAKARLEASRAGYMGGYAEAKATLAAMPAHNPVSMDEVEAALFNPSESDAVLNLESVIYDLEHGFKVDDGGVCVRSIRRVIKQLETVRALLTQIKDRQHN